MDGIATVAASRCVLVLEDSVLVAFALEAALADRGFDAIVAGSLAAAEERLGKITPMAALLDLHLPDGTALALADRLNRLGCKVALCSGIDADGIPSGYEFAAHFIKPVAPEALAAWVAAAVPPTGA